MKKFISALLAALLVASSAGNVKAEEMSSTTESNAFAEGIMLLNEDVNNDQINLDELKEGESVIRNYAVTLDDGTIMTSTLTITLLEEVVPLGVSDWEEVSGTLEMNKTYKFSHKYNGTGFLKGSVTHNATIKKTSSGLEGVSTSVSAVPLQYYTVGEKDAYFSQVTKWEVHSDGYVQFKALDSGLFFNTYVYFEAAVLADSNGFAYRYRAE
ncbi:hypothetical protein [Dielma fastidiosa]|uniref:Uncharacterized protein n=1 Tax=Dielma fastidiosa TaxID=1034346 RepID=A0AB35US37_9FIRM|nr:hypothetical protein [Dielma fastidiosa]MDY5168874.1 hypothetical protein [Dielma fastidiosa]